MRSGNSEALKPEVNRSEGEIFFGGGTEMQNPTCGSMTKSAGGSDRTQTLKKVWMWGRLSQSSGVNPNRRHTHTY